MPGAAGRLRQWFDRVRTRDPYWDAFLHRPPADPRNIITPPILEAPGGSIFPSQTEVHDPAAMSGHLKELAKFFGADATGISAVPAEANGSQAYPYAVTCLVAAVEEPKESAGLGGQFAVQKCATANFNVASYIRELGYAATVDTDPVRAHAAAAAAGLGTLAADGRLVARRYGRSVGVAGLVLTDLPLAPDTPSP